LAFANLRYRIRILGVGRRNIHDSLMSSPISLVYTHRSCCRRGLGCDCHDRGVEGNGLVGESSVLACDVGGRWCLKDGAEKEEGTKAERMHCGGQDCKPRI